MKIIVATKNENKVKELREILADTDIEIVSMKEAGIDVRIIENGKTFEENAAIKAETVRDASGEMVFADDSGLEIDFLNKEPGVHSARFMGEDTSYDIKNAELLRRLEGVAQKDRTARFICAIAIARPGKETEIFRGTFEGRIADAAAGENGFGYDPIFYVPQLGLTSAQLTMEQKNAISHRGQAMRMAVKWLGGISR